MNVFEMLEHLAKEAKRKKADALVARYTELVAEGEKIPVGDFVRMVRWQRDMAQWASNVQAFKATP